jgi:hypothetical protein
MLHFYTLTTTITKWRMTKLQSLFWKILLPFLIMFVLTNGASILADWLDDKDLTLASVTVYLALPVIIFFIIRFFNKKYNQLNPSDYGFNHNRFFINFIIGMAAAILIMGSVICISLLFGVSIQFTSLYKNVIVQLFELLALNMMYGSWEEMYFRGLLFNTLKTNLSFQISALVTALLFTVLHAGTYDMSKTTGFWYVEVMLLAYVLLYLYLIAGSIWVPLAFHFTWDLVWSLTDDTENKVGLVKIPMYAKHAILLDEISIFVLIATLVLLIAIKHRFSKKIIRNNISPHA